MIDIQPHGRASAVTLNANCKPERPFMRFLTLLADLAAVLALFGSVYILNLLAYGLGYF